MNLRTICKSKIHHATVTAADVDYIGSIGIDVTLMEMVDIIPGEQVSVWNGTSPPGGTYGACGAPMHISARPPAQTASIEYRGSVRS